MEEAVRGEGLRGRAFSDSAEGLDLLLMDELLAAAQGFDCFDLSQPGSASLAAPFRSAGFDAGNAASSNPILREPPDTGDDTERSTFSSNLLASEDAWIETIPSTSSNELILRRRPGSETGIIDLPFVPRGPAVTVEDRLIGALNCIKDSQIDGDFLVQIWAPALLENRLVLTTRGRPFSLDSRCERLRNFRSVSVNYHFSADEYACEPLGLPGRVFVGKVPEWTPDVRYFNDYEYPRVDHAKYYDVRGTIALPIFERHDRSCLGVVELVTTVQKINYGYDVESICNALQVRFLFWYL